MFRLLFRLYGRAPAPVRKLALLASPLARLAVRGFSPGVRAGAFAMVLDPRDNAVFRYLRHGANYERVTVDMLRSVAQANGPAIFVDVGAGYGFYSLALADLAGEGGLTAIHAFEPDPRCVAALRRSVAQNGLDGLITVNANIVGDETGSAALLLSDRASTSNRTFASAGPSFHSNRTLTVGSLRLHDYMKTLDLKPLLFVMKMDVEGNELRVFRGMERLLDQCRAYCIQFEFYPVGMQEVGQDRDRFIDYVRSLEPQWAFVEEPRRMRRLDGVADLVADMARHASALDSRGVGTAANYIIGCGVPAPG